MHGSGPNVEVQANFGVPTAHVDVSMPHAEVQFNPGVTTSTHVEMHGPGMDIHTTNYGNAGHVEISGPHVEVSAPVVHANVGTGFGSVGQVDVHVGGGPHMEVHGTGMHANVSMPTAEVRVSGGPAIDARLNTNMGASAQVNFPAPSANVHVSAGVSSHILIPPM